MFLLNWDVRLFLGGLVSDRQEQGCAGFVEGARAGAAARDRDERGITQRFLPTISRPLFARFAPFLRRFFAVLSRFPASWRQDGENGRKMA